MLEDVSCRAGDGNQFCLETEQLVVRVVQRIRRDGSEQMWESLSVYAEEEIDGWLVVRVLVCHPDWEDRVQIAAIRSRPQDAACPKPFECDLKHVKLL